jgi:hypothetical protein
MMDTLTQTFDERLQEIEAYLDLLDALERQVRDGHSKIGGSTITAQQQKILYSSVYLQLYNLVEATINWCISAVASAAADGGKWTPSDLSSELQREWVRVHARTHVNLAFDKRLDSAIAFLGRLCPPVPLLPWSIEQGGGGNWDDHEIENISDRLGCTLPTNGTAFKGMKRIIRDDKNSLALIRDLRNKLAHGSISFSECGAEVTVSDLRDIKDRTAKYLRAVVESFTRYIDEYHFLMPGKRPPAGRRS